MPTGPFNDGHKHVGALCNLHCVVVVVMVVCMYVCVYVCMCVWCVCVCVCVFCVYVCTHATLCASGVRVMVVKAACVYVMVNDWGLCFVVRLALCGNPCCLCVVVVLVVHGAIALTNVYILLRTNTMHI